MAEEIMNVGFIGGGPISTAICKGILKNDLFVPDNIWVSAMYDDYYGYWTDVGANRTTHHLSHGEVCRECQIIFLETELENFSRLINQCNNTYAVKNLNPNITQLPTPNHSVLFVSMVPGLHMERLLMIYMVIEALTDGAVKQGVPRKQAQSIVAHIVAGCGLMVLQSGTHPAMLKDEVSSPGAIAGLSVLEDGRIRSLFIKALEASSLKFNEVIEKVYKFLKWI